MAIFIFYLTLCPCATAVGDCFMAPLGHPIHLSLSLRPRIWPGDPIMLTTDFLVICCGKGFDFTPTTLILLQHHAWLLPGPLESPFTIAHLLNPNMKSPAASLLKKLKSMLQAMAIEIKQSSEEKLNDWNMNWSRLSKSPYTWDWSNWKVQKQATETKFYMWRAVSVILKTKCWQSPRMNW